MNKNNNLKFKMKSPIKNAKIEEKVLIKKVEKELDESDFKNKNEYKKVIKQIYINGPVVKVVPNLSEG